MLFAAGRRSHIAVERKGSEGGFLNVGGTPRAEKSPQSGLFKIIPGSYLNFLPVGTATTGTLAPLITCRVVWL